MKWSNRYTDLQKQQKKYKGIVFTNMQGNIIEDQMHQIEDY